MNQETQQNTTDTIGKIKPRMYVSWRMIPLNFLLVALMANMLSILPYFREVWETGLLLTLSILPIGIILLLVISISKKPMGYIKTRIINSVFLASVIIPAPFVFVLLSFGAGLGGEDIRGIILGYVILSAVGVYGAAMLNRKFQKSETELGITRP